MRKMFVEEEPLGLKAFRSWSAAPACLSGVESFLGPVLTLPFLMLAVISPSDTSFRRIRDSDFSRCFPFSPCSLQAPY